MYDLHECGRRDAVSENAALRRRVEARTDLNERILWAGRPLRAGWLRGALPLFFFGLAWSALVGFAVWQGVVPLWTGEGAGAAPGGLGRWGETLFFVPFVAVGIGLVLSPVWAWLSVRARIYAVTDRRAMVLGRASERSWRASEMFGPDRADHRNGRTDLFFARMTVASGRRHGAPVGRNAGFEPRHGGAVVRATGFRNLRPADADAAERALRTLLGG